ncbi:MAG: DUF1186 domain-containing protein [Armatimonadota bacterium]
MTISDILAELAYGNVEFPRQAVEEAVRQRDEITPELLRVLEAATPNIAGIVCDEAYSGHIYAMYLLAQFRDERAYQPLVDFISSDQKSVEMLLNDIITEDLGRLLASVCNGDTRLIRGMIENTALNEYVRMAGLDALVVLVAQGIMTRDEVIAYFLSLFQGKLEREPVMVWGGMVGQCCDLYAGETAEEIYRAFDDELVDTGFINKDAVVSSLARGKEKSLEQLTNDIHHTFIDDAVQEMSRWAYYPKDQHAAKTPKIEQFWKPAPIQTGPKVGRNEPCPCGSGKKYKKCCG